jgi:hypothetical protein
MTASDPTDRPAAVQRGAASTPQPVVLRALIEALLPLEDVATSERDRLVDGATSFASGQIGALPVRLRLLFALGVRFFRIVTFLAHLRPFTTLTASRRRAWVERWAYGSWSLGRQLFRPIRSVAIVSFYSDVIVAGSLERTKAPAPGAEGRR